MAFQPFTTRFLRTLMLCRCPKESCHCLFTLFFLCLPRSGADQYYSQRLPQKVSRHVYMTFGRMPGFAFEFLLQDAWLSASLFGGLEMFEFHGMGFMSRRARAEASQYDMSERNS